MKRLIHKADVEIDETDYLSHLDKVDEEVKNLWAASKAILEESDTLDNLPKSYIGKIDRLSQSIRKSIDVK